MAFFSLKNYKINPFKLKSKASTSVIQTPDFDADSIEDFQREEAIELLATLYTTWANSWNYTSASLTSLNLSPEAKQRLQYCENEQKAAILSLLASLLVAWDNEDKVAFTDSILDLAKELRPTIPYSELENEKNIVLSPLDFSRLRHFIDHTANLLKSTVSDLKTLSSNRFRFQSAPLSLANAEALLREKLNLNYLDFKETDFLLPIGV